MSPPELGYNESMGDLLRGILNDIRTLIREEISLARVEMHEQAGRVKAAAVGFGIAAGALMTGGMLLLIAICIGVADLLNWPVWAGFLLIAAILCITGIVMLSSARRHLRHVHAVPPETVSTLKENSAWIARRLSSVRR